MVLPLAVITNTDRAGADDLRHRLGRASWLEAHDLDDVTLAAREAVETGAETVLVVGGDGTQRAAAQAIAGAGVALVPVPAGSVNLLARLLGIDGEEVAAAAAERGTRIAVDVGVADGEVFLLNATTGADAEAVAATSRRAKERFGPLAFVVRGAQALARPGHRVRVEADGVTIHDGWASAVLVLTNGRRGRPGVVLDPDAGLADGLLHVHVVQVRGLADVWRLVAGVARRRPDGRVVERAGCREVVVSAEDPFAVQLDGDPVAARRRLTCRVEPGALLVATPPSSGQAGDRLSP